MIFTLPAKSEDALWVVVNADSGIESLTHNELVDIFMGRYRTFPDGRSVTVYENASDQQVREAFYRSLVNRNLAQVNAYWARLQFSGRVRQPEEIRNLESLSERIGSTPSAISFVRSSDVTDKMKVVHRFDL
ncbi:hypothetical protein L2750_01415 [Shewanella submarina]|uniref:Phosphate ABC transporter substrate-binding protein n=1 Tax=Shewanella submarina TaxID=2016376 RepID=A0ABV7GI71_9GAMM|nr:hypothetical protein [Shewanella submarina]MCL1035817.1 hypothetical protein [Shewanella submarina]